MKYVLNKQLPDDLHQDFADLDIIDDLSFLPRYGMCIGVQFQDGTYKSYLKQDSAGQCIDLLKYFIDNKIVAYKDCTLAINNEFVPAKRIFLVYENKEHPSLFSNVKDHMSRCVNTRTTALIEYRFCFGDGCESYVYEEIKTAGHHASSFADVLEDIEETLENFLDDKPNIFRKVSFDNTSYYEVRIVDEVGDIDWIETNVQELKEALVSVRIVKIDIVIDDNLKL